MLRPTALALALALAPWTAPRGGVAFQAGALAKDARLEVESTSDLNAKIAVKMGGQAVSDQDLTQKQHVVCTVESTAADDHGTTSAKLTFGKCEETRPNPFGGVAESKDADFSGHSYEVKRDPDDYVVADATTPSKDGKATIVSIANSALSAPLAALLVGKKLEVGEKVELDAVVAAKTFVCFAQDAKVKSATLELTGEKQEGDVDCAVFRTTLKMTAAGGPGGAGDESGDAGMGGLAIECKGDVSVSKSGARLIAANLPGTVSMKASIDAGNGQKIDMEASGTTSWKFGVKSATTATPPDKK